MNFRHNRSVRIFGGALLVIAAFVFLNFLVFLLWNWLMPPIFGLTSISFYQAAGLFILSKILFSGFGKGHRHHRMRDPWRRKFEERFSGPHTHSDEKGA